MNIQLMTNMVFLNKNTKLNDYFSFLNIWNKKLLIVGKSITREKIIEQSMILYCFLYKNIGDNIKHISLLDIGAGAGLIGVIWKISNLIDHVICVERSSNRAMFLKYVAQHLDLNINVIEKDIKEVEINNMNKLIITAQAFATLHILFNSIDHLIHLNPIIVLLKQENIEAEIVCAEKEYSFDLEMEKSDRGTLVFIKNLSRLSKID